MSKHSEMPGVLIKHADNSQLDKTSYIEFNILVAFASYMLYEKCWASELMIASYIFSKEIVMFFFAVLLILMMISGILITWKERTKENAYQNALMPFCLALLASIAQYSKTTAAIYAIFLLAIVIIITGLYIAYFMRIHKVRIKKWFIGLRDVCFFVMVPIIIVLLVLKSAAPTIDPVTAPEIAKAANGNYIDTYKEELAALHPETWRRISLQQKMDVLQTVCNIECANLGVSPVKLEASHGNAYSFGSYDRDAQTIWINTKSLEYSPVEECIDTVCHEVFHHMQHTVCESDAIDWDSEFVQSNVYFSAALSWRDNFADYKSGRNSSDGAFQEYSNQPVEVDAREYATKRVAEYIETVVE